MFNLQAQGTFECLDKLSWSNLDQITIFEVFCECSYKNFIILSGRNTRPIYFKISILMNEKYFQK